MAQNTLAQMAKKLCLKVINYLNIGFVGYEISEITQHNDKQIIQVKNTEDTEEKLSITHMTIVIIYCIVLCMLLAIVYALRIVIRNKKSSKKNTQSTSLEI